MIPGKRINLWAIEPGDLSQNYLWANDPELIKLMGFVPIPRAGAHIHAWLDHINTNPKMSIFAIKLNDGTYIGNVILDNIESSLHGHAEVGLFIGNPSHRGKGYGKEAVLAVMRYAFEELRLHRIYCRIMQYNVDSQKFFKNLGFTREGIQREAFFTWGRYWDIEVSSMMDYEFQKKHPYIPEEDICKKPDTGEEVTG